MLPAIFPMVTILPKAPRGTETTVRSLCEKAGLECRVTGPSAERKIYLLTTPDLKVSREPGSLGTVSIGIPKKDRKKQAILALGILAYAVFDYAARESLRNRPEAILTVP